MADLETVRFIGRLDKLARAADGKAEACYVPVCGVEEAKKDIWLKLRIGLGVRLYYDVAACAHMDNSHRYYPLLEYAGKAGVVHSRDTFVAVPNEKGKAAGDGMFMVVYAGEPFCDEGTFLVSGGAWSAI